MSQPTTTPRATLRTGESTNVAVRKLAATASAKLGGARVTHDRLLFILADKVGPAHLDDVIEALRVPADDPAE